jgi:hypothetical protein
MTQPSNTHPAMLSPYGRRVTLESEYLVPDSVNNVTLGSSTDEMGPTLRASAFSPPFRGGAITSPI